MRLFLASLVAAGLVFSMLAHAAEPGSSARITTSFDEQWRFLKGDPKGADTLTFNDSVWKQINVPHDWSIEGPFSEKNPAGPSGAFLPAGIGWYRKHFFLPPEYANRRIFIDFDGIMARNEIWINGASLGKRINGYVGFRYDLTGKLNFGDGKTNVIAVRIDNARQPASRWYTGSGIYRHVRLVVSDPIHIVPSGIYVTTPVVGSDHALVHIQTSITNQSRIPREVALHVDIFGPAGQIVQSAQTKPQTAGAARTTELTQDITVLKPRLWDTDHPNLYRAVVTLRSGSAVLDNDMTTFGIREIRFEPLGFFLNDRPVKLKGVCLHSDGGAFGAAVPMRVWERRLEQLKLVGCNAIRTTHNPPASEFLDLCDRMGFLVIDEFFDCWTFGKSYYDYHLAFKDWAKSDLRDTLCRDRNHPSIILYSIGNEVRDVRNVVQAKRTLIMLRDVCHQLDSTRPVTQALYRPDLSKDYKNGFADLLDVIGQNYRESDLMIAYAAKPTRKMLQTESGPDRKAWIAVRDNPACAGQFLWTGVDYLGEAHKWPWIGNASGLLDRTGAPRPQAFERRALWTELPMVRIARRIGGLPPQPKGTNNIPKVIDSGRFDSANQRQALFSDWTPHGQRNGKETVEVYGNCQEIELFLNGKSLGTKSRAADDEPRTWIVPFEPGVIRAVGKNEGQAVAIHELHTAGAPAAITLSADTDHLTPDWDDVCQVRAIVVDNAGVPVPDATPVISFKIAGPGVIAATDSGNNATREPFQGPDRHAFNGQCVALVKASAAPGKIVVTASSPGLTNGTATIEVKR